MVLILTGPIFKQLCKASVGACPGHRFLKVTADARQGQGLPSPLAFLSIIFWMSLQFQNKLVPSWTNTIQWKCKVPRRGKVCLPPGFFVNYFLDGIHKEGKKDERCMKMDFMTQWISWHNTAPIKCDQFYCSSDKGCPDIPILQFLGPRGPLVEPSMSPSRPPVPSRPQQFFLSS